MAPPLFYKLVHAAVHDPEAARELVKSHPEVLFMRNLIGETVLHYLAVENQAAAVRLLLELGAKARVGTVFGQNALQEAILANAVDAAAVLEAAGARLPTPPRPSAPPRVFATSEQQFIRMIKERWPRDGEPNDEVIDMCRRAIRSYRASGALWRLYLELLRLRRADKQENLKDAMVTFLGATWLPVDSLAWYEFGCFLHGLLGAVEEAKTAFQNAIDLDGPPESYAKLAHLLAEQGRQLEALFLLAPDLCPFADHPVIACTRDTIERLVERSQE